MKSLIIKTHHITMNKRQAYAHDLNFRQTFSLKTLFYPEYYQRKNKPFDL